MKILFLAHRLPFPPHKGEKIRALNVLRYLTRSHEVHLGCLIDESADLLHVAQMRAKVTRLVFERIYPRPRKALALLALLRSRSIAVACFYSRRLQRKIDDLIEEQGIEAVFCSSSQMAEYVFRSRHRNALRAAVRVMDLIDVDSYKWQQYSQASPPWTAWIYRHEARCLGRFEQRIAGEFDRVLVVSEQEKSYFPGGSAPHNLSAMSNGVDLEFFSPAHATRRTGAGPALVFTGVMDYRPNVDGIRWFVEKILPAIQQAVPDVHLYIVGNRPTEEVLRLGTGRGVTVTGFVADTRDYLAGAAVCIVPLRIARGIQNKLLEAMAMGRPVVTTRDAYEGIRAESGRDLLVAGDEFSFAASVISLLQHPQRAAELGRNARTCVENRYSWDANLAALDEMFAPQLPTPVAARCVGSA